MNTAENIAPQITPIKKKQMIKHEIVAAIVPSHVFF
jgi:hypothetical protein